MKPIKNTRALRRAIIQGSCEFRLCLNGGVYSRKTITLQHDKHFRIINHIDESVQRLTGNQLYTKSHIGRGMKAGAFLAEYS